MIKFKNITGHSIDVFKPAELGGTQLDADGVLEVAGEITDEAGDAYIVGEGDGARAWPKAVWELITDPAPDPKAKSRTGTGEKSAEGKEN